MITCPSCQRDLPDFEKFCRWCGAILATGADVANAARPAAVATAFSPAWQGQQSYPAAVGQGFLPGVSALRHPKESAYFALAAIAAGFAWLILIWIVILVGWIFVIGAAIALWLSGQFFRAQLLGNAVRVSERQFPEIYHLVKEYSARLGLSKPTEVFIVNGDGVINALAIRQLKNRYILLMSGLVDVMLASGSLAELGSILGHELGHHALGHTSLLKGVFLAPSRFVPFLGTAYARACELSADRVGMWLAGSKDAAIRGLAALACGSRMLTPNLNLEAFLSQEEEVVGFFGFLNDLFSTHPRITKRVQELRAAEALLQGIH